MFTVKLADINIAIQNDELKSFFNDYLCAEPYDFFVEINDEELQYEKNKSDCVYKDIEYLKLAVYRKISEQLPYYNGFLIHGSGLSINNKACLLAGLSGAGKSTHARLLRQYYDAYMINDDKPLIRFIDGIPYLYGTPYDGKHHLSNNISFPIKNIIFINQGTNNRIIPLDKKDSFTKLYMQTYKPINATSLAKTISLVNDLNEYCNIYDLYCDVSVTAANTSYEVIK